MEFLPGFFCILIFTFYLGTTLVNKFNLSFSQYIFLSSLSSLWISWIIVFFLNLLDINFTSKFIYFLLAIILFINYFFNKKKIEFKNVINFSIFFLLFFVIIFFILLTDNEYLPVFNHGDAVFQWNGRWAFELFENKYKPYGNYPVFWPGLWSLIYKSLGSKSNWILPHLSLFIIPILSIFSLYCIYRSTDFFSFFLTAFFLIIFSYVLSNRYLIGYMDVPIAILSFIFFSTIFCFKESKDKNYLIILSFLTGIISVTKQVGFIYPMIFGLIIFHCYYKKKISLKKFIILTFIAIIPLIIFLLMYRDFQFINFVLNSVSGKFGNQSYLHQLSLAHIKNNHNLFYHSFKVISERFNIYVIIFVTFFGFINFLNIKNKFNLLGSLFFIFAFISFYFFANYGSYDDRNGWFIIPMIYFSFLCFLKSLNMELLKKKFNLYSGSYLAKIKINKIIFILFVLTTSLFIFIEKKLNFNYVQKLIQSNFGGTYYDGLYGKNFLNKNQPCSKVVTNLHILAYNYFLFPYYDLDEKKSRVIVLSSDTTFETFKNQNLNCKDLDLFIFNKPLSKSNQNDIKKLDAIVIDQNKILFKKK